MAAGSSPARRVPAQTCRVALQAGATPLGASGCHPKGASTGIRARGARLEGVSGAGRFDVARAADRRARYSRTACAAFTAALPLPHWVAGATSLGVPYPGDIKSEVSALAFDAGRGHRLLRLVRSGATHGGMPLGAFAFDALGVLDDAVEVIGLMLATGT